MSISISSLWDNYRISVNEEGFLCWHGESTGLKAEVVQDNLISIQNADGVEIAKPTYSEVYRAATTRLFTYKGLERKLEP